MLAFGFPYQQSVFLGRSTLLPVQTVNKRSSSSFVQPYKRANFVCKRSNGTRRDFRRRGDGRRPNRVGELIRREISPIISDAYSRAFRSSEGATQVMISVVDVRCTDDLRNARVQVSVFGDNEARKAALSWLRTARKEIRFELAQCVHLKFIPDLSFEESEMLQAVNTINIINKLERQRTERSTTEAEYVVDSLKKEDDALEDALRLDGLDSLDDDDDDDVFIVDIADEDEEAKANEKDRDMDVMGKPV